MPLFCTFQGHGTEKKKKKEITQHALFIETCLSSAVDIFFFSVFIVKSDVQQPEITGCGEKTAAEQFLSKIRCRSGFQREEVQTGRLVRHVRASYNKLFPVQAAFTSGLFHSVNSEAFFFSHFVECIQAGNRFSCTQALRGLLR